MAESFKIHPGDADTYLNSNDTILNFGALHYTLLGWLTKQTEYRTLLRVDFSGDIPAGATIDGATLYMHTYASLHAQSGSENYYGYRVRTLTRDWVEGDNTINQDATWEEYKTDNAWGTAGCKHAAADYDSSVSFGNWNPESGGWNSVTVTAFLQDAVTNRNRIFDAVLANYTIPGEGESAYTSIVTREAGDPDYDWYIEGTYTAAAPSEFTPRIMIF